MLEIIRTLDIWFYALTIPKVLAIVLTAIFLWTVLAACLSSPKARLWRLISALCLLVSMGLIVYAVLLRTHNVRELILQPFQVLQRAKQNREAYREALMNGILFIPIGLTVPHLFSNRLKDSKKLLLTVLIGLCFSLVLETLQYCFSLGVTEADDVICNTVGTMVAALHIFLVNPFKTVYQR